MVGAAGLEWSWPSSSCCTVYYRYQPEVEVGLGWRWVLLVYLSFLIVSACSDTPAIASL